MTVTVTVQPPSPVLFGPAESGRAQVSGHWFETVRFDPLAIALFHRHYSYGRPKASHRTQGISGPGTSLTLIDASGFDLFLWKISRFRRDAQTGVECTVFHKESSALLASDMIRQADALAWRRWPLQRRHFTFVDRRKVGSVNPGYCFKMAGWRSCGQSAGGLDVLEVYPDWSRQ